jgi:transcriptional regulator with XRE-family HTH domain
MSETNAKTPYQHLGNKLRQLREQHRESMAEVSGAVEIDEVQLTDIETGKNRPSEDILTLLISHFGIEDERADELWDLAGYGAKATHEHMGEDHDDSKRTAAMMIMLDPRVMYSDAVEVVSNPQGVILNFSQTAAPNTPPLTISRIGMSYDQAKAVMGILHQVLYNQDNPGSARRIEGGDSEKH